MKKTVFLMLLLLSLGATAGFAQVTIGADQTPRTGAGLDLNTANLGLLLPNVTLGTTPGEFVLVAGATELQKQEAKGMVVYYPGANLNGPGVYVWDGAKWNLANCTPKQPGEITFDPELPATINLNGTLTAFIEAVDGATSYNWAASGGLSVIAGQGGTSVTIQATTPGPVDAALISVAAVSDCGTSAPREGSGTLTVNDCSAAPSASIGDITKTVTEGTDFTVTVTATGATSYNWTYNTSYVTYVSGQGTATITLKAGTASFNANTIACTVSNDCGDTSAPASGTITVNPACPAVSGTIPSIASSRTVGDTWTVAVTPSGGTSYTYAWGSSSGYVSVYANSDKQTVTLRAASAGTAPDNSVYCVVTNECGNSYTVYAPGAVSVAACPTPSGTIPSQTTARTVGDTWNVTVTPSGGTSYQYQWYSTNSAVTIQSGGTSQTVTLRAAAAGTVSSGQIYCSVTNQCGVAANVSVPASFTVAAPCTDAGLVLRPAQLAVIGGTSYYYNGNVCPATCTLSRRPPAATVTLYEVSGITSGTKAMTMFCTGNVNNYFQTATAGNVTLQSTTTSAKSCFLR